MAVQTQTLYDHVKRKKRTCECVCVSNGPLLLSTRPKRWDSILSKPNDLVFSCILHAKCLEKESWSYQQGERAWKC